MAKRVMSFEERVMFERQIFAKVKEIKSRPVEVVDFDLQEFEVLDDDFVKVMYVAIRNHPMDYSEIKLVQGRMPLPKPVRDKEAVTEIVPIVKWSDPVYDIYNNRWIKNPTIKIGAVVRCINYNFVVPFTLKTTNWAWRYNHACEDFHEDKVWDVEGVEMVTSRMVSPAELTKNVTGISVVKISKSTTFDSSFESSDGGSRLETFHTAEKGEKVQVEFIKFPTAAGPSVAQKFTGGIDCLQGSKMQVVEDPNGAYITEERTTYNKDGVHHVDTVVKRWTPSSVGEVKWVHDTRIFRKGP